MLYITSRLCEDGKLVNEDSRELKCFFRLTKRCVICGCATILASLKTKTSKKSAKCNEGASMAIQ